MAAGLLICAVVLAICTVIILIAVKRDLKAQAWNEQNKSKKGKRNV